MSSENDKNAIYKLECEYDKVRKTASNCKENGIDKKWDNFCDCEKQINQQQTIHDCSWTIGVFAFLVFVSVIYLKSKHLYRIYNRIYNKLLSLR